MNKYVAGLLCLYCSIFTIFSISLGADRSDELQIPPSYGEENSPVSPGEQYLPSKEVSKKNPTTDKKTVHKGDDVIMRGYPPSYIIPKGVCETKDPVMTIDR